MKDLKKTIMLLMMAVIWGYAFVAQADGGDLVGPYTFNGLRMLLGALCLAPVILIRNKVTKKAPIEAKERKMLLTGGILCGVSLFAASTVQQLGLTMGTSAGKAGFLTAIYILIIPIISIFLKKRCPVNVWIAVFIALLGLYLLCIKEGDLSISFSDLLIIICAFCFAIQILLVDHYSPHVDGLSLAEIEFIVTGVISLFPIFFVEVRKDGFAAWLNNFNNTDVIIPFVFAGIFSCCIAYVLQIEACRDYNPTVASLIMSLESVFAAIFGAIFLHEIMSSREFLGAAIMFIAVVIAKLPFDKWIGKAKA